MPCPRGSNPGSFSLGPTRIISEVAGHGRHRQWVRGGAKSHGDGWGGWDPSEKGSGCHSRALTPETRGVLGEAYESRGVGGEVTVYRG